MAEVTKEMKDKLDTIIKNYPKTFEWIKHKCNWERMTQMAVLSNYESYIDELMNKEKY